MAAGDDADLVRRCLAGDGRSFEMLVTTYERVVYSTAYRMVGDPDDARDLTQSVFLKAYRNLSSFDQRHRFFSWIYRITLNETLNFLRQRRPKDELDDTVAGGGAGPEDDAHGAQVRDVMDAALRDIPAEQRLVIVLRHFQDLSHAEMSQLLGVPEKTVKSRLYTARQTLEKALRRRGVTSA